MELDMLSLAQSVSDSLRPSFPEYLFVPFTLPGHEVTGGIAIRKMEEKPNGRCFIHLRHDRRDGRINISGAKPKALTDDSEFPYSFEEWPGDISVSELRTPKAIASEITRRLLPSYLEAFQAALKQADGHDAYNLRQDNNVREIANIVGGTFKPNSDQINAPGIRRLQVSGSGSVHLELSGLDFEVAKSILKLFMAGKRVRDEETD